MGLTYETYQYSAIPVTKDDLARLLFSPDAPLQWSLAQPPGTDQTTVYITLLVPRSRDGVTAAGLGRGEDTTHQARGVTVVICWPESKAAILS